MESTFTDTFFQLGYPGLLIISFLAATILPLSSELIVVTMVLSGYNNSLVLTIATLGNVLGAYTNYYVGYYGEKFFLSKYIGKDSSSFKRMERFYHRFGAPSLLLAWVPIIGDPLCIVPGVVGLNRFKFGIYVTIGKFLRYYFVIEIAIRGV